MQNQTAVTVAPEVVPETKMGMINIPPHLRGQCHLVRHEQVVQVIGDDPKDPTRYIVKGSDIKGTVPVRKQYVVINT